MFFTNENIILFFLRSLNKFRKFEAIEHVNIVWGHILQ